MVFLGFAVSCLQQSARIVVNSILSRGKLESRRRTAEMCIRFRVSAVFTSKFPVKRDLFVINGNRLAFAKTDAKCESVLIIRLDRLLARTKKVATAGLKVD